MTSNLVALARMASGHVAEALRLVREYQPPAAPAVPVMPRAGICRKVPCRRLADRSITELVGTSSAKFHAATRRAPGSGGRPGERILLVFGGSQAVRRINDAVTGALTWFARRKSIALDRERQGHAATNELLEAVITGVESANAPEVKDQIAKVARQWQVASALDAKVQNVTR